MKKKFDKSIIIKNKKNTYISNDCKIGKNVIIYENNRLENKCTIGDDCILYPGNRINNSIIGNESIIESSVVENSVIGERTKIGPFSHLRPKVYIGDDCKIGNFVEVKNSRIGNNTKISHLTYVGDSDIGNNCNIGCGVIFINYNGKIKQKSSVGNGCFIGSNCNIIAPCSIGNFCYVCAGSILTKNLNDYDFAIGRAEIVVKPDLAKKYLK